MSLPAQVLFGTVIGSNFAAIADGSDLDVDPDSLALEGQIIFTPDVQDGRLQVTTATPPVTVTIQPVPVAPVGGVYSLSLIATDSTGVLPANWTWTATFNLYCAGARVTIPPVSFLLPAGTTVDMTLAAPVPTADGWQAIVSVEASAAAAAASAASADASAASAAASAALVGAPADSAVAVIMGDGSSLTRATIGVIAATSGDQTARVNSWLTTAAALGFKQAVGSFSIAGTVVVPAGVAFDITKATFTQTTSSTVSFTLAAGASLIGGDSVGKATDYTPGTNVTPTAIGVKVIGAGAAVRLTSFLNHAGAGILLDTGASNFTGSSVTISAPALSIPAGDSACFGVYVRLSCGSLVLTGMDVSYVSIGIIASIDTTHLGLFSSRIHDIPGQHGVYLQNGIGAHVEGNAVWNIALNGLKFQMFASNTADAVGTVVNGLTADNCGDCGLSINNTDTALTRKYRGISISNVIASNCVRGLYLGSVRTGSISNLIVYACSGDGVTFLDCWDVQGSNVNIDTAGQVGIRITSVTNGTNQRIKFTGVMIQNAANLNVASNIYGIYVADATDLTFDGLVISCTNGFMQYGIFFAGGTTPNEQTSFTLRNSSLSGSTGTDVRLVSGPVRLKSWVNNRLAGTVLNFPVGFVTRVGGRGLTTQYVINALPTADTFLVGDELFNSAPAVASPKSWLCTVAGGAHGGTWAATTAYALGVWRRIAAGRVMECTTAGTSSSTEPVYTSIGATTTDGTVVWTWRALAPATLVSTGSL